MALPKIAIPKFSVTLPSTGEKIHFRPFLVKEEKVLLIAMQSEDESAIIDAVRDVVVACVDEKINAAKLPYFDIEYLFLNIRAKSVGEQINLEYRHTGGINYQGIQCEVVTPVQINIEEVKVDKLEGHTNKIMLTDTMGIEMKYPSIDEINSIAKGTDELEMLARCIKCVFDEQNVYDPDNLRDSIAFIENLNSEQFSKITQFFNSMPKLRHSIKYTCRGCGQEDVVKLEGLSDFF